MVISLCTYFVTTPLLFVQLKFVAVVHLIITVAMKGMTKYARERMLLKNTPRRVLNLEERVAAIRMYDHTPVYQQVAVTFKCSWEQIKNIISKRESILKYYANCQVVQQNDGERVERQRKINFLGNVMYEFIKRAYVHGSLQLNDDIIRERALEFRNIIGIDSFYPNKTWIRDFKKVYNVNLNQLDKIVIVKAPLKSLDSKSIVSHCRREVERILQSTQRPKTAKNKKGNNKRAIANNQNNDNYVNDEDEDAVEIRSESKDSHDNDSRNNVMYLEDGNNFVDDDVDDVMIGNEPSQDLYYGDGDGDEVINENEDGLTINYGDYEYNEEDDSLMPLFSIKAEKEQLVNNSILTVNKERIEDKPEITTRKCVHSDNQVDENLLIPEIALKVEEQDHKALINVRASSSKRFRSDSANSSKQQEQDLRKSSADSKANSKKVETARTSKNPRSSSRSKEKNSYSKNADKETKTSSPSSTRIMNYSGALNWMRPLQHFAIAEEDFSALNLLQQLSGVYERAQFRQNNV